MASGGLNLGFRIEDCTIDGKPWRYLIRDGVPIATLDALENALAAFRAAKEGGETG